MEWFKSTFGLANSDVVPKGPLVSQVANSPADSGFFFAPILPSMTTNGRVDLFFKLLRNTSKNEVYHLLDESWLESPLDTIKIIFFTRNCRGGKGEKHQFKVCLEWLIKNGHEDIIKNNLENFPRYGTYKDLWDLFEKRSLKETSSMKMSRQSQDASPKETLPQRGSNNKLEKAIIKFYVAQLLEDKQNLSYESLIHIEGTMFTSENIPFGDARSESTRPLSMRVPQGPLAMRVFPLGNTSLSSRVSLAAKWAPTEGCK